MAPASGDERVRIRELGVQIGELEPGELNAITDVAGVQVGQVTVSWGEPPGTPGKGPARTGVTAIWPHRRGVFRHPAPAGSSVLNGTGEIVTLTEIDELGMLSSPVLLTNSMQIGSVYDTTVRYFLEHDPEIGRSRHVIMPAVGECDDSFLNDSRGLHVQQEHVWRALDDATTGPVVEGCVGAGTGMTCLGFKGGIGTSSRMVEIGGQRNTVGALVMTNFGQRSRLTFAGVNVGRKIRGYEIERNSSIPPDSIHGRGSCIVVIATDAPLTNHHLARLARRASFGLVRTGSTGHNGSGEIALAFSTAYTLEESKRQELELLGVFATDPLFEAAVDAAEEAVLNSLTMATTTVGRSGNIAHAIPLDQLEDILRASGVISHTTKEVNVD